MLERGLAEKLNVVERDADGDERGRSGDGLLRDGRGPEGAGGKAHAADPLRRDDVVLAEVERVVAILVSDNLSFFFFFKKKDKKTRKR